MPKPFTPSEQAAALRVVAAQARRLAQTFARDADKARLLRYADELEQRAALREPVFALNWGLARPRPDNTRWGRTASPDDCE